ncbi:MAG: hypothetical protein JW940_25800 [Polyangiaceae bacterium]|nr:hypothetical protein [Polyangiaceae bacterium]
MMTGPLAGAPAVRSLRLYREGRLEFAPGATFTLLDAFQRTILVGARLNYNLFDWLALGVWGGGTFGPLQYPTKLADRIQDVNDYSNPDRPPNGLDRQLTAVNMGPDFRDQLGSIKWVAAPQITATPFRGKIALFAAAYADTDLYFFAGPAFIGLSERKDCKEGECSTGQPQTRAFPMQSRMAIAPTFGFGLTFYTSQWSGIGLEWRALPFSWNKGGFDVAGRGQNKEFPDNAISSDDREFDFMQLVTVSFNIYYPFKLRMSE